MKRVGREAGSFDYAQDRFSTSLCSGRNDDIVSLNLELNFFLQRMLTNRLVDSSDG
jgi:hypothetical protein